MRKSLFLCTDSHRSYIQFAKDMGIELHQIKRGKYKEGIYHIQHINAFHNNIKDWMYKFRGIATEYLGNYIYWFKWLQYFNAEKDTVKSKQLFVQASTAHSDTKLRNFKIDQPIFVYNVV